MEQQEKGFPCRVARRSSASPSLVQGSMREKSRAAGKAGRKMHILPGAGSQIWGRSSARCRWHKGKCPGSSSPTPKAHALKAAAPALGRESGEPSSPCPAEHSACAPQSAKTPSRLPRHLRQLPPPPPRHREDSSVASSRRGAIRQRKSQKSALQGRKNSGAGLRFPAAARPKPSDKAS